MQGVELLNADRACTAQEVDSLNQDVCDSKEEIRHFSSLLEAREEKEEGEWGSGHEEEWEMSDLTAKREEAEDRRMGAEEELKNLKVCTIHTIIIVHNLVQRISLQEFHDLQKCTAVEKHLKEEKLIHKGPRSSRHPPVIMPKPSLSTTHSAVCCTCFYLDLSPVAYHQCC